MGKRFFIVGVMGGGATGPAVEALAFELGNRIAKERWILLNGGRAVGVMDASARGAKMAGGFVVGILPDSTTRHASDYLDIPIVTGLGQARNSINILSSDVVVACPGGAGTLCEIALALKNKKPLILLGEHPRDLFKTYQRENKLLFADTAEETIALIHQLRDHK